MGARKHGGSATISASIKWLTNDKPEVKIWFDDQPYTLTKISANDASELEHMKRESFKTVHHQQMYVCRCLALLTAHRNRKKKIAAQQLRFF